MDILSLSLLNFLPAIAVISTFTPFDDDSAFGDVDANLLLFIQLITPDTSSFKLWVQFAGKFYKFSFLPRFTANCSLIFISNTSCENVKTLFVLETLFFKSSKKIFLFILQTTINLWKKISTNKNENVSESLISRKTMTIFELSQTNQKKKASKRRLHSNID